VLIAERVQINYNAPEYALFKHIDLAYDVWCVGWLLYHMCTWYDPFAALDATGDNKEAWRSIEHRLTPLPRRINTDLCRLIKK
jgi:hypothetical protein